MSAPEGLINRLYRAGNLRDKDIQSILTSFQAVPKQVDEDTDLELIIYAPEIRQRIDTITVNPGFGTFDELAETRDRVGGMSYIREIPSQVNVYPLLHTENGTSTFLTTGKKFTGGLQTDGTYYQSVPSATRLNPTATFTVCGWLRIPSGITSGKIIFKSTQYNLEVSAANTLSFNVNSKTPVDMTFVDDTWFHFAATYASTSSGQKIYKDAVLQDSDAETGAIATSSNSLGILGTSGGTSLLGNNSVIAHLTMLNGEADGTWITNHKNGILDTNAETEITTIPFVAHGQPKPDCSVGRCQIN